MSLSSEGRQRQLATVYAEDEEKALTLGIDGLTSDPKLGSVQEGTANPQSLQWEEYSEEYEDRDPAMSTLAKSFADATVTGRATSVPAYCRLLMHEMKDSELDYTWKQFLPCVSYTNVTRSLTNNRYPRNLTKALATYGVTGSSEAISLGEEVAETIGHAMHLNCEMLRCGMRREDKWGLEAEEKKPKSAEEEESEKLSSSCQQLFVNNVTLSFEAANQCQADICIRARDILTADPEIGGPGVFVSYATQLLIALIFMSYFFVKFIIHFDHRRRHKGHLKIRPELQAVAALNLRHMDAHPAFTNALESFQKLQAWFSASLIVAACIRQASQQVSDTDHYLLLCVALNGVALIPLTLLIMHNLKRRGGWSTFYLSSGAFAMSAGFLYIAVRERSSSLYSLSSLWHHSQWCGRKNFFVVALPHFLAIHSFLDIVDTVPDAVFWLTLVFCSFVLLGLFVTRLDIHDRFRRRLSWARRVEKLLKVFVAICYPAVLTLQLMLLIPFVAVVNWQNWGFGQIVALSVFLPVLYDYLSERLKKKMTPYSTPEEGENTGRRSIFSSHHLCCNRPLILGKRSDDELFEEKERLL